MKYLIICIIQYLIDYIILLAIVIDQMESVPRRVTLVFQLLQSE